MSMKDRGEKLEQKVIVMDLVSQAVEEIKKDETKVGILLCEGDNNSIDKAVYSLVFPELYVVPVGGCTTVVRFTPKVRKFLMDLELYAFGIIDRDALSKKEIKRLNDTTGVYTTKLPFIENIVCAPETLKIISDIKGLDYGSLLSKIEGELVKILWQKMKEALPINLGVERKEHILSLSIGVVTKNKQIHKQVSEYNILYSYRDKVLMSIVGNALGLQGKKAYYIEVLKMLNEPDYKQRFAKVFSNFIPKFAFYELENERLHP